MQLYNHIVCGGTFDHFHKGHKTFLRFGLKQSQHMSIGIASDRYPKSKQYSATIESYNHRRKSLEAFLDKENVRDRVSIVAIDDMFGPTINADFSADAILVSDETQKGALIINQKRLEKKLRPFVCLLCKKELAEDGNPINSSRIRKGEINRKGKVFVKPEWLSQALLLPENLRERLQKPIGTLIDEHALKDALGSYMTVGDIVTKTANALGLRLPLAVIDFVVQRHKTFTDIKELGFTGNERVLQVENPASTITPELFKTVIKTLSDNEKTVILVSGEEDLAVLPLVLAVPLGAKIFYGQPNVGMVLLDVTEDLKEKIYELVSKFNTRGH